MDIRDELKRKRIFFDGGMGSMLQEWGLLPGEPLQVLGNLLIADFKLCLIGIVHG